MRRKVSAALSGMLLACLVSGCVQENPDAAPERVQEIDHIALFTDSVAMNLDSTPGLDGVGARVFAFSRSSAREHLVSGEMDLLMYAHEGAVDPGTIARLVEQTPFRQWTYGRRDLQRHRFRSPRGLWGYRFVLDWGSTPPPTKRVLILVRYRSPSGKVLYSAPNHVALKNQ